MSLKTISSVFDTNFLPCMNFWSNLLLSYEPSLSCFWSYKCCFLKHNKNTVDVQCDAFRSYHAAWIDSGTTCVLCLKWKSTRYKEYSHVFSLFSQSPRFASALFGNEVLVLQRWKVIRVIYSHKTNRKPLNTQDWLTMDSDILLYISSYIELLLVTLLYKYTHSLTYLSSLPQWFPVWNWSPSYLL